LTLGILCKDILPLRPEWESISVKGIAYDSRSVGPGDLFVAIPGLRQNGAGYAAVSVQKGAVAVVSQKPLALSVPLLLAEDSRKALAFFANRFYGDLTRKLTVVGITGTNGKTTIAFLIESIFKEAGLNPGLMGTVLYRWKNHSVAAPRTTPESVDMHRMMHDMVRDGVRSVVMEVSSHALALDRVLGMVFKAAVFSNLTQDHLDFHGTIEAYGRSKAKLFGMIAPDGIAVVNADDPYCDWMCKGTSAKISTYGMKHLSCDYRIRDILHSEEGTRFVLNHGKNSIALSIRLWGQFNVMNATAAAVCGLELGLDAETVQRGIDRVDRVPGRMEGIASSLGFRIIIDYAHTPDALENVLKTVRAFTPGKVIAVFGCGGDRDRGKRPLMGAISARLADRVLVTSDNPRSEDPEDIVRQIVSGMGGFHNVETILDRNLAIRTALGEAKESDTIVIAGKGHETYQEIGGNRLPFDDRLVVERHLKRMTET